jgi:hypothetical protein
VRVTTIATIIPMIMTFLRPIKSDSLPEKGLEIRAEIVKREIIKPFLSAPPNRVINVFNSGSMILKLIIKKSKAKHIIQKFFG